jgi:hypothetical protein
MSTHPHQAGSDEADPEKQSTPAGVVGDLEEEAEETGATTTPTPPEKEKKPPAR